MPPPVAPSCSLPRRCSAWSGPGARSRGAVWRPLSALAIALVVAACAPRSVTVERTATPSIIVVPTELPNGRVEIAIQPTYVLGEPTRIDVSIVTTQGTITGPTEARVTSSGTSEPGRSEERRVGKGVERGG